MEKILDLYTTYAWSWLDNFGKETHGHGRCTSPLDALVKVCKAANVPITDELKEKFGVNDNVSSLKAEIARLSREMHILSETVVKQFDLIEATNKTVKEATEAPPKGKGGRPAGSKNKK